MGDTLVFVRAIAGIVTSHSITASSCFTSTMFMLIIIMRVSNIDGLHSICCLTLFNTKSVFRCISTGQGSTYQRASIRRNKLVPNNIVFKRVGITARLWRCCELPTGLLGVPNRQFEAQWRRESILIGICITFAVNAKLVVKI